MGCASRHGMSRVARACASAETGTTRSSSARGRVGIVVGDVVGKGVLAAAAMAQLRNALRVYAMDGAEPTTVLAKLNRLADTTGLSFATVLYAIVDTTTQTCRYASAGHPPPLLVRADGSAEYLEGGRSIPIGVHADVQYQPGCRPAGAGRMRRPLYGWARRASR